MKSVKLKKRIFAIISFILVILIVAIMLVFKVRYVYIDLDYCKELGRKLFWLNLNQFYCSSIDNADNQHIQFYFRLNDYDDYSESECVKDIAKVRNTIAEYLNNNPHNELNNQLIICTFETFPGETMYMYNYNFKIERESQLPEDFMYYQYLSVNLSYAQEFSDARIIELKVDESDDITVLENWGNLECLNISGKGLTEENQKYLCEILPDCTIICNGETINEGNVDNVN